MYVLKRILFSFIVVMTFSCSVFAKNGGSTASCPSIHDIKSGNLGYWIPLYVKNQELASTPDVERFKQHVKRFHRAIWNSDFLETGHCDYRGDNAIVNEIIFAQDAWRPKRSNVWTWIQIDKLAECYAADASACEFLT